MRTRRPRRLTAALNSVLHSVVVSLLLTTLAPGQAAAQAAQEPLYRGRPMSAWLAQLGDLEAQSVLAAVRALSAIGAPAVPALARVAEGQGPAMRRAAAVEALKGVGLPAAPVYRRWLADNDPAVRARGVAGLSTVNATDAAPAIRRLAEGDPDWRLRALAVNGLVALGGPDARAVVAARLADPSDSVRSATVYTMTGARDLGWAVPLARDIAEVLARDTTAATRRDALRLLTAMGPKAAAALPTLTRLRDAARRRDPEGRAAVELAAAVVAIGGEEPPPAFAWPTAPVLALSPAVRAGSGEGRVTAGGEPTWAVACSRYVVDATAFAAGGELAVTIEQGPATYFTTYYLMELRPDGTADPRAIPTMDKRGGRETVRVRFAGPTRFAVCPMPAAAPAEPRGAVVGTYRLRVSVAP